MSARFRRRTLPSPYRCFGLTLVELVVVAAIAAILLSIALPSYQRYVQRGQRAEAIRAMLEVAACQERVRAGSGYYDTTRCAADPWQGEYRLAVEPHGNTATLEYTIIASPARMRAGDYCGDLVLNQLGTRSTSGDPARIADCWGGR